MSGAPGGPGGDRAGEGRAGPGSGRGGGGKGSGRSSWRRRVPASGGRVFGATASEKVCGRPGRGGVGPLGEVSSVHRGSGVLWKGAGYARGRLWGQEPCRAAGALALRSAPGLAKVGVAGPWRRPGPGPRTSPGRTVQGRGSWDRHPRPRWGPASEDQSWS